jgi:hypothetical protein
MSRTHAKLAISAALIGLLPAVAAADTSFSFSSGDPDGKIATATLPDVGAFEIESADDFALTHSTSITSATFTGLLTGGATVADIGKVVVEIYRVFPKDSDVGRTSGPTTFSTSRVPTRVNSPSDMAFDSRDTTSGLTISTTDLGSFAASNSVTPGGIQPLPGIFTGGNGSATGEEVEFGVTFTSPFVLPADHYFFVPQVQLSDGAFLWLSAPKPIVSPGTAFPPGFTDLQTWTRDAALDPDWLRIGTDITHQGPFNAAFSLTGAVVPEPSTWAMMLLGFVSLSFAGYRRARKAHPAGP